MKLSVLYQDDYLLALDKPSGMLSVPGKGIDKADCAVSRAASQFGWIREVHRLDQATSGILLLSRDAQTHRLMSQQFADRRVSKTYEALCKTLPVDPQLPGVSCVSGRITVFQRLDIENRPRQMVDALQGKQAITEWQLLEKMVEEPAINGRAFYRIRITPLSGRTHQIRLALSVCGAAIPGDRLYGGDSERFKSDVVVSRLMLHANELSFEHPRKAGRVVIQSPVPF